VALHSLAARPSLPVACAPAAAGPPPGFGAGAILTAPRRTYGWAGRFHMAPTWCEYTLVSFCHLLLSLKNYISICFRTFPRPASLPGGIQDESEETRPECSLVSGNLGAVPRHTRVRVTGLVSSSVVHISFFPLLAIFCGLCPPPTHFGGSQKSQRFFLFLVLITVLDFAIKNK
jgi:hypothetical protein